MYSVLRHLRQTALKTEGGLTDGQLLERYLSRSDQTSFEELVRRHGVMVLGVCRRLLHDEHAAEDAFQATFLVLVRKAKSIQPRERIGNWLYGVALRTAHKARVQYQKRRAREELHSELSSCPDKDDSSGELQEVIDQELSRLSVKYRLPLLLCDMEGLTRKEASARLGWPEGTIASRLNKARSLLAKRLARQGLYYSTAGLTAALSMSALAGPLPRQLVVSTLQGSGVCAAQFPVASNLISSEVLALTQGVLRTMTLNKLKMAFCVFVLLAFLGVGAAFLWHPALAEPGSPAAQDKRPAEKQIPGRIAKDEERNADNKNKPTPAERIFIPPAKRKWQMSQAILRRNEVIAVINEEIDVKAFQQVPRMKLRDFLSLVRDQLKKTKGMDIHFLVEAEQFRIENPDAPDVLESEVSFSANVYTDRLPLATLLKFAFMRVPTRNATYLIRRGVVVITTKDTVEYSLLKERITAAYDKIPAGQALLDLGAQTGAHIQLDPRANEQLNTPISAVFANNVTLKSALTMLTDMVDLAVVEMEEGIYVTTPENAAKLRENKR